MRFYNQQHKFYCGIDLHARKMYVCIIDQKGKTRVHQNLNTDPEPLFNVIFSLQPAGLQQKAIAQIQP